LSRHSESSCVAIPMQELFVCDEPASRFCRRHPFGEILLSRHSESSCVAIPMQELFVCDEPAAGSAEGIPSGKSCCPDLNEALVQLFRVRFFFIFVHF